MPRQSIPPATAREGEFLIPLTQGMLAVIDAADHEIVSRYIWTASKRMYMWYATSYKAGRSIYLHRLLMNPPHGFLVDHIDRDGLNCRRSNLRIVTRNGNAQNSRFRSHNTSGFRGVSLCCCTGRWRAEIRVNGRGLKLGRFDTKEEAARAYDHAAVLYHGIFAQLNFPVL